VLVQPLQLGQLQLQLARLLAAGHRLAPQLGLPATTAYWC
jgi:hypothetical protein